ncbi:MAG: PEP/pyruvate-binding domain-containing protein [Chloroflexi bacterium]|nr:PEP/pyruvate-binding domain-containing protein [Chloroflexota bacterium]MBK6710229.1 PEP/pyruvate-binding domain-containing protein [Chloroflexota bacterium]MBK7178448.1 PEP/pyruvate-binding domain-containing protein [Chloroflexota bacterium]MBK7920400.1 PEP/pyruvate-binding domain-containing protein [Chloroflexota bacterium]MBP7591230.1 PEP/pyruvate-binding domain-containing protein [Chloroflexota bacterium]
MEYLEEVRSVTPAIDIYIRLAQYPILCDKIRRRMRQELFRRGIISKEAFYLEVRQLAIQSQRREGLLDPYYQEETIIWQKRKDRIREFHTDALFANNLGGSLLNQIIDEVLADQPAPSSSSELTFNPEIAPWELLFRQGEIYEAMIGEDRERVEHHLREIKVVLIKRMISDQLPYIGVAKKVFTIADLRDIYRRRIGSGKIGGKAAGMMLAYKILKQNNPEWGPDIGDQVTMPETCFIATEAIYDFYLLNNLADFMNQKYRSLQETQMEYPEILDAHLTAALPEEVVEGLEEFLSEMGRSPIIVRSSSLLEDNFGTAFAGKYDSFFCPNQGTPEENLNALMDAIRRVFASTLNPDALLYRGQHGMIDYDERMGVLLQRVEGQAYGRYFFPTLAGVGFSRNPYRWNPRIRREDGFLRLVWGLGTRAVDRVDKDYPRMIGLSHPQLRPETTASAIRQHSQWYIDVVDLEDNQFKTVPVRAVLDADYPHLRALASIDEGDYFQGILSSAGIENTDKLVLTFNNLTKDRNFIDLMRHALNRLEKVYGTPVDIEFAVQIKPGYPQSSYLLSIIQCRPLSQRLDHGTVRIPPDIPREDILFTAHKLIPDGQAEGIRYIVYVDPEKYRQIGNQTVKLELGRAIGRLNQILADERFVLMGPGRWGSANLELGVRVTYADIHNTLVLIEIGVPQDGQMPELSYGTHFLQDLVEAGIFSLPLHLGGNNGRFDWDFFRHSPNSLAAISPADANLSDYLTVIDLAVTSGNRRLKILMDGEKDEAVGFLVSGNWSLNGKEGTVSTF